MVNKIFFVNFKSNKFTILIFLILEMGKLEYNIFNLPHDYATNDHLKTWSDAKFRSCRYFEKGDIMFLICYIGILEKEILCF